MRAIGIVLAGGNNSRMRELSNKRATAAMPIAGGFRSIDFVLSNMSNSHIQKVAVFTQYNAKSLNEHLNSSKWWDFGRKQGGLYVFTPTTTPENSYWYRGTLDAMAQNLSFLKNSHEPYVVIASGDGVYKLDYNKVLEFHIAKKADFTVVTADVTDKDDPSRFGVLRVDGEGRITDFEEEERHDFVNDILIRYKNVKKIYAYPMDSYWSNISSVDSYYNTNMDFLNKDIRDYFFRQYPDIYSKVEDLPPAKYNVGSNVKNSLVSSGCIINGTVENSILFKEVYIGNNCTIKNSIILNDVYIGDNTHIENCIVESRDTIRANTNYTSEDGKIRIVVEKNERYAL